MDRDRIKEINDEREAELEELASTINLLVDQNEAMQQQIEALLSCIVGIAKEDTSSVVSSFKNLLTKSLYSCEIFALKAICDLD